MADDLPIPVHASASQALRTDPCVKDWTCARCGRRLLLRRRMRRPGGCGHCGAHALAPSPRRPRWRRRSARRLAADGLIVERGRPAPGHPWRGRCHRSWRN